LNSNTPYEVTIAQKLQQIPVPDMADAIWVRVERQLDIDMPTDDGSQAPPSSPPGSGWIGGAALALFVAALVFVIIKREKVTPAVIMPQQNNTTISAPGSGTSGSNKEVQNNAPVILTPGATPNKPPDLVAAPAAGADSLLSNLPLRDTPQANTVLLPQPQVFTDSVKPKPGRGVRGISDGDYRIVPTNKDSS
jgi:hypothetical protein